MRSITIAYIGNFRRAFQTEVHWAKSLEALGHKVIRLQEDETDSAEVYAVGRTADLTLYTKTGGFGGDARRCFASLHSEGKPTASIHLDLYLGLRRERSIAQDGFWSTKYVFTADGDPKSQQKFRALGINHHWLRAGVLDEECVSGTYRPELASDVAFVGSVQRYHPEWPYRARMISYLQRRYGPRFRVWPGGGPVVRDQELNDLYASAKVIVGDSLCPGFTHERYWSDRVYETLGRGGFLIHPKIVGLEDEFVDGQHLAFYQYGQLQNLRLLIDSYLNYPEERAKIAAAGQELVREKCNYKIRMAEMLDVVGTAEGWTE